MYVMPLHWLVNKLLHNKLTIEILSKWMYITSINCLRTCDTCINIKIHTYYFYYCSRPCTEIMVHLWWSTGFIYSWKWKYYLNVCCSKNTCPHEWRMVKVRLCRLYIMITWMIPIKPPYYAFRCILYLTVYKLCGPWPPRWAPEGREVSH